MKKIANNPNDPHIYVHLHTDSEFVMKQIANFANYMNHYFSDFLDSSLVIERVCDGIVYIFKDLRSFINIHAPIHPAQIQQIDKEIKIPQNPKLSLLPHLDEIPRTNLSIWFDFTNLPIDEGIKHMRNYYSSIDPDILFRRMNDQLFIQFPTGRSALRYLAVLLIQYPYDISAK